jgi:hypothetical protein
MPHRDIKITDAVFLSDGADPIGAVRRVAPNGRPELIVYVENAGDFVVPFAAVKDSHFGKVILDVSALDEKMRRAIGHSHEAEDPEFTENVEDAGPHTRRGPSTP